MLEYVLFALGFVLLVKGADFLIDGSVAIAKRLNVSNLVIGLTVVAFGTSLPELVVNVVASLDGNSGLAVGNILGSNICNILLILGVAAFLINIKMKHGTVWAEIPLSILAAIVLAILANDMIIDGAAKSQLTRADGFVMLCFFAIFLYYVYGIALKGQDEEEKKNKNGQEPMPIYLAAGFVLAGIAGLYLGGNWVVDGAIRIAEAFGVTQTFIGLTIVAIGTSLPELMTTVVAALKKNADLAVGNIVGSNIFNIFFVLGISAIINPVAFEFARNFDLLMVVFSSVLLFVFIMFFKPAMTITRREGFALVMCYIIYLAYLVANAGI